MLNPIKPLFIFLLYFPYLLFGEYHGQYLQDKYVNELFFHNKKNGVFVDIGAHQPITDNNTYFFEKELGWTGVCIDPHPCMFKALNETRSSVCLNVAVVPLQAGKMEFLQLDKLAGLSGLTASYGKEDLERIQRESALHGEVQKLITVDALPINQLLASNNLFHIDFLSLDIEGGELDILKAIDFKRFHINVITVENNWEDPWHQEARNSSIRKYMESAGYQYITRLGVDEVYKKKPKSLL